MGFNLDLIFHKNGYQRRQDSKVSTTDVQKFLDINHLDNLFDVHPERAHDSFMDYKNEIVIKDPSNLRASLDELNENLDAEYMLMHW